MTHGTVVVEVSGGCVNNVHGLLPNQEWVLLDWDNLLGDTYAIGDCEEEWASFGPEMQAWIQTEYPDDYAKVQERIAEDRRVAASPESDMEQARR